MVLTKKLRFRQLSKEWQNSMIELLAYSHLPEPVG